VGVPTLASGANFQRLLTNANIYSSANTGLANGNGIATCNIEFWPTNYGAANAISIPNASATLNDWGDTASAGNYGSMQIHNHGASQVLFAYNRWGGTGGTSDLGIGNRPTADPDWTFAQQANVYTTRNLYVLVRPGASTATGPSILQHPCARTVPAGGSTTLSVLANGALAYQWRRNGVAIAGATGTWLDLNSITPYAAGTYDVVVTGAGGGTTFSLAAPVTVTYTPAPEGTLSVPGGTTADLLFHGYPGISHEVQRSIDLANWLTLQTIVADANGDIPFQDPAPPSPRAYYRVQPVLP
jgi:hypothetical protein